MKLINMDGEKNPGKNLIEIGILLMTVNFLCAVDIWQSILQGWKVAGGGELFFDAFIRAGENISFTHADRNTCYIYFLSAVFSFLGNREELVLILNLFLQIGGAALFYRGVRAYFGVIPSLVTAVVCGIISGCFYPVVNDTSMHLLWFLTALLFWIMLRTACASQEKYELTYKIGIFTTGVLTGLVLYVDLSAALLLLLSVLLLFTLRNTDKKTKGWYAAAFIVGALFGLFAGIYLEYGRLNLNLWFTGRMTMLYEDRAFMQYISLTVFFVFILTLVIWNGIKSRPANQKEEKIMEIAPKSVTEAAESEPAKENKTDTVNPQNVEPKPIKFIENPLPLPKKHVKKEMDYAFEPSKEQMHYDLNNYNVNDDYDLK